MKKYDDDDDMAIATALPEEDYAEPQRSNLPGISYSVKGNKGPKEEITKQKTFEDFKALTTASDERLLIISVEGSAKLKQSMKFLRSKIPRSQRKHGMPDLGSDIRRKRHIDDDDDDDDDDMAKAAELTKIKGIFTHFQASDKDVSIFSVKGGENLEKTVEFLRLLHKLSKPDSGSDIKRKKYDDDDDDMAKAAELTKIRGIFRYFQASDEHEIIFSVKGGEDSEKIIAEHIRFLHEHDSGSSIRRKPYVDDDDMAEAAELPEIKCIFAHFQASGEHEIIFSVKGGENLEKTKEFLRSKFPRSLHEHGNPDSGSSIRRKPYVDDDDMAKAAELPEIKCIFTHFQGPGDLILSIGENLENTVEVLCMMQNNVKPGFDKHVSIFSVEDLENLEKTIEILLTVFPRFLYKQGPDIPGTSYSDNDSAEIEEKKEKISEEIIDAEIKTMRETKIFALNHQLLNEESVKYFCKEFDFDFELLELKFIDCNVDKDFLSILFNNIPNKKVKILNLSENNQLDFSMIEKLMDKLQCGSLDVSDIEFQENNVKSLGTLKVKELILDYGTFPKSISWALAELLKNGIRKLSLVDGNISLEQLEEINKTLSENEISLKVLDLSHICLKEKGGIEAISKIINRAEGDFDELCLFNCGINADSLKEFTKKVDKKIFEFDIGCNAGVVEEGMQAVIDVAIKVGAKKLDLSSLSLKAHHIQQLKDSQLSKSIKVSVLNLSNNSEIDGAVVGELIKAWGIIRLNISLCQFQEKDYRAMVAALEEYQLESIRCNDLSRSVRCDEYTDILRKVTAELLIKT